MTTLQIFAIVVMPALMSLVHPGPPQQLEQGMEVNAILS
jgi:hypothetical protein